MSELLKIKRFISLTVKSVSGEILFKTKGNWTTDPFAPLKPVLVEHWILNSLPENLPAEYRNTKYRICRARIHLESTENIPDMDFLVEVE